MAFLNKIFRGDKIVWLVFMLLLIISVVEVFSAASTLTYKEGRTYWWAIREHSTNLLLGFLVVYLAHLVPYRFYKAVPVVLVPLSVGMLVWVLVFGEKVYKAARWIDLGFVTIQPSELAKVGVVMGTALILSRTQTEDGANDPPGEISSF